MKKRRYDKAVSEIIKKMTEKWYTQAELGIRSGYSTKHINRVLNMKCDCSIKFLYDMKYPLGVEPSKLVDMMYVS